MPLTDEEIETIAKDRANWLVDAVITAASEQYMAEAIRLNAEKAIKTAIKTAMATRAQNRGHLIEERVLIPALRGRFPCFKP